MRRALPFFVAAALLMLTGAVLFAVGRTERRLAEVRTQFLALDFDRSAEGSQALADLAGLVRWVPGFGATEAAARRQHAAAEYWGSRTSQSRGTPPRSEADALTLLVAANATYRRVDFTQEPRRLLEDLRQPLDAYAEVLKRAPWQFDAAYNYQFVARLRAALALRAATPRRGPAVPAAPAPGDRTIHGHAGGESPGIQENEFKIIVPHQSDERREEQEAGKSAPRARKG